MVKSTTKHKREREKLLHTISDFWLFCTEQTTRTKLQKMQIHNWSLKCNIKAVPLGQSFNILLWLSYAMFFKLLISSFLFSTAQHGQTAAETNQTFVEVLQWQHFEMMLVMPGSGVEAEWRLCWHNVIRALNTIEQSWTCEQYDQQRRNQNVEQLQRHSTQ